MVPIGLSVYAKRRRPNNDLDGTFHGMNVGVVSHLLMSAFIDLKTLMKRWEMPTSLWLTRLQLCLIRGATYGAGHLSRMRRENKCVSGGFLSLRWASTEQHTVMPSPQGPTSVDTRKVCTTISWGDDSSRTECLTDTPRSNRALHSICTIYYGHRVCH